MAGKELLSTTIDMCSVNNPVQRTQLVIQLLILVLMSLLMAVHLHYRSPDFPFTADSAVYFEQARNLVNVGSALNTVGFIKNSRTYIQALLKDITAFRLGA